MKLLIETNKCAIKFHPWELADLAPCGFCIFPNVRRYLKDIYFTMDNEGRSEVVDRGKIAGILFSIY